MKCILVFIHFIIFSTYFYAQVDEYKMRHEQFSHSFKRQQISDIPQRATIIDSQSTRIGREDRIVDVLENNSELYKTQESYSLYHLYHRGNELRSSDFWLDGVNLGSEVLEKNFSILNYIFPENLSRIELLSGNNIALDSRGNSASVALFTNDILSRKDSFGLKLNSNFSYGNMAQKFHADIVIQPKKSWANQLAFSMIQNDNLPLSDSRLDYQAERVSQISNKFQWKINEFNQLRFYINLGLSSYQSKVSLYQEFERYKKRINPSVFSYVQWLKTAEDESKWYSQLQSSFSVIYTTFMDSATHIVFPDIDPVFKEPNTFNTKLSLQLNGFKNISGRSVNSFGASVSLEGIAKDIIYPQQDEYFFPEAITNINLYFKREIKPSSDYSWIIGANAGAQYLNFSIHNDNWSKTLFYDKKWSPNLQFQTSWIRHLCENSNYSLNLFLNYTSPTINQIRPFLNPNNFYPNINLKSEKSGIIEGNIYRKFEDKLEANLSVFYQLISDAIVVRDYNGEGFVSILPGVIALDPIQSQNAEKASNLGGNLELKYHISKAILIYGHFNYSQRSILSDKNKYEILNPPYYGNLGLKYKKDRLFVQIWSSFNLSKSIDISKPTVYVARSNMETFDSYFTANISANFQINKYFNLSFNLNNIMNQKAINYGSYIQNFGRNGSFGLQFSI